VKRTLKVGVVTASVSGLTILTLNFGGLSVCRCGAESSVNHLLLIDSFSIGNSDRESPPLSYLSI